jgi:hypothetical protein
MLPLFSRILFDILSLEICCTVSDATQWQCVCQEWFHIFLFLCVFLFPVVTCLITCSTLPNMSKPRCNSRRALLHPEILFPRRIHREES